MAGMAMTMEVFPIVGSLAMSAVDKDGVRIAFLYRYHLRSIIIALYISYTSTLPVQGLSFFNTKSCFMNNEPSFPLNTRSQVETGMLLKNIFYYIIIR